MAAFSRGVSCFDDADDLSDNLPSGDHDNIDSRLYSSGTSDSTESDSSRESKASRTQQENEAGVISDDPDWREDDGPIQGKQRHKVSTHNKKNYCYVCGSGVAKISRHLFLHADEEHEIAQALALPKKSRGRVTLLTKLRNRGNYKHNQEVLRKKSEGRKLRRHKTAVQISSETCTHCIYCKGMFKRQEMWRHLTKCPSKTRNSATGGRTRKTRILGEIPPSETCFENLPSGVWEIPLVMKPLTVSLAIQKDFLFIQLAHHLCEKYGHDPAGFKYIQKKLRQMARLLLALKEKSILSFEDAAKPENFYKVAEAVRDIARFNRRLKCYKDPSVALELWRSLKNIGAIALRVVEKDAKKFMKLCAQEEAGLPPRTAPSPPRTERTSPPSTVAFTHDVQLFYNYMEAAASSAVESLKMRENPEVYRALSRVTLAQLSILNKNTAEVSKMTLKTFHDREEVTHVLSKHSVGINILSRSGRSVAVLLTSELVSAITLLVNMREGCCVHKDNPFLFAKPDLSATSTYNTRNCIKAFTTLCRAKNPAHLRSVRLHKHIARVFQILHLENDELDHLAKRLGRDIRADRDYYRTPEGAVELAKIAMLLLAMEKGSLGRFKGNSLEDIEIQGACSLFNIYI